MPVKKAVDTTKLISAPMPGRIVSLNVKPGQKVLVGEGVIVMEAMKMRNVLRAERDGVIKKVNVKEGDNVPVDSILVGTFNKFPLYFESNFIICTEFE